MHNLALVAAARGEEERAWALYEECLTLARRMEHGENVIAAAVGNMGDLARQRGDHARARVLLEESLALRRRSGDTLGVAVVLVDLATLLRAQGDAEQALARYTEALALCGPAGYARTMAQCLEGVAAIAATRGQPDERAARLAGASAALRQENGLPLEQDERADVDQTVAATRAALGDDAFAAACAQGQELAPEQAVAEAMRDLAADDGEMADARA